MSAIGTRTFRAGAGIASARRGLTLIELMVVLGIIAILAGLVLLALHHVRGAGDSVSEQAMVSSLKQSVIEFEKDFGFPPPLVVDSGPAPAPATMSPTYPVGATNVGIAVWGPNDLSVQSAMTMYNLFRMTPAGPVPLDNTLGANRCSEYSLAYYLVGALDIAADGVDGLGFTVPNRDGSFTRKGRVYSPLIDVSTQKTRTGVLRLSIPLPAGAGTPQTRTIARSACKILDRWNDGASNGSTIRYYRWEPAYYPPTDPTRPGQVQYWNVPVAVGGYFDLANGANNMNPPLKSDLKDARWAIVSAGPDGMFGDEQGLSNAQRIKYISDNIVEVGK